MKRKRNKSYFFVLISILFLTGCNESATTSEKNETDTTSVVTNSDTSSISDTSSMPIYDPVMEPLTVGAKFSKKLGDTLNMKMYEFRVKPGDSWALHNHPDHAVYVLQGGKMALFIQAAGRQDTLTFPTGFGLISGPLSDSGKNIGNTTIKLLVTDIYRPRGSGASSMPGYDPALDPLTALTVGGTSCKMLRDTLNIKMFECSVKPGKSAALHAHPDHAFYVLQGGKAAFYAQGAGREEGYLKTGEGWIGGPVTDSAKNIGNTTIKTLEIDIYRPRGK